MEKTTDELIAWAAGLFDGEGSSSCYVPRARITPRRQMQVSQASDGTNLPPVLIRFHDIVGAGNVTGPYRGYLFYWKTTRITELDRIAAMLWPYLGERKKTQFLAMTVASGRALPPLPPVTARPRSTEVAWAAGLFDGEGSVWASGRRATSWKSAGMEIAQSSESAVPDLLTRFAAIVGAGTITGPHPPRSPWSQRPQYRWSAHGRHQVSAALRVIWPHLNEVKRAQIRRIEQWLDDDMRCID